MVADLPTGATGADSPVDLQIVPTMILVIHPAALPPGAGLQIFSSFENIPAGAQRASVRLVQASPQCTGS